MKIIHTGDWHIGKMVNGASMLPDQEYALRSFLALLAEEKPDALIIAGDVYDRSVPPVEAVELLDKTLCTILLEMNIPVLMIAGNHDSPDRLGFGSRILKNRGLYIEGRLQQEIRKVSLQDEYGPVHFYLLPYAPPAVVRDLLADSSVSDHASAMAALLDGLRREWQPAERNVMVTHGFVRGVEQLEECESEKALSFVSAVGGAEYVDVGLFDGFTYTALGHLHSPQAAGNPRVRYSGSLLKYSFSEANQKKAVTVVDIGKGQDVAVSQRLLPPFRDMRKIKGTLAELLDPAVYRDTPVEDYLHVTLTDEGELIEPMSKLRSVYPNVLQLEFAIRERTAGESRTAAGDGYKSKTKLELFREFYQDITGQELSRDKAEVVAQAVGAVELENGGEAL